MKRNQAAFMKGIERAQSKQQEGEPATVVPASAGNWSRLARQEMETKIREQGAALEATREILESGVAAGRIAIRIPAAQIDDEVGTDRILDLPDTEGGADSFAALKDNIAARGQRVPIRVRPADPAWRPDPEDPRNVEGVAFLLQSGRRRLRACLELGLEPLAFISLPEEGGAAEDLQERFFENVSRKDSTALEKLFSIGLIARDMEGASQVEIAKILNVGNAYVSRGMAVIEYFDRLQADLDLSTAGVREIDAAVKSYRAGEGDSSSSRARPATPRKDVHLPFTKRDAGGATLTLRAGARGRRKLEIVGRSLSDDTIEKIVTLLEADGTEAGGDQIGDARKGG